VKVLHVVTLHTPTNAFGGPTRVALNLAGGLRGRGVDAELVTLGDGFAGEPLPTEVEGVPARVFRAWHVLPRFEVSGITSPSLLAGARKLVKTADVVHVHLMRDLITLPVAVAALQCGRPLVLQTHGMIDPSDKPLAKVLDALAVKRLLRRADAVLHLTEWERGDLEAVAGKGRLANPVRLVNGTALQERRTAGEGPPTVLYLARFQNRKRPQDLVQAVPEVLKRHPGARFVLAGPDSGELEGTLALARELGVEDSVEYAGALSHADALEAFRHADVYVLPSVDEPFAMSLLESMSVGVPVVVRESNGLASDIERTGAGRVVQDASGLAAAVLDLLEPEVNRAASEAAWRLVRDELSLDAVLDTLQAVYRDATAAGGLLP
jgi:glycosyltransferase involved in cell wall biosynthesis